MNVRGTFRAEPDRAPQCENQVPPLRPHKNESYDTTRIATFVLFFLLKAPVAQGFFVVGNKRIISLCYSPAINSVLPWAI